MASLSAGASSRRTPTAGSVETHIRSEQQTPPTLSATSSDPSPESIDGQTLSYIDLQFSYTSFVATGHENVVRATKSLICPRRTVSFVYELDGRGLIGFRQLKKIFVHI